MTDLVTIQEHDTHVLISMDDGKANALSFDMFDALNTGLDCAVEANKLAVLTGRPGKFSAGLDLKIMHGGGEPMIKLLSCGADLSLRLLRFPTPVVLAVSGHAVAMGALLCLSADYRIGVAGDYKLGLNETAIGMTLPWFAVELARTRLDETQVNAAVGLARIYSPDEALSVGYLDETAAGEELLQRTEDMARTLATLDMAAHGTNKARVREDFLERLNRARSRDIDAGVS